MISAHAQRDQRQNYTTGFAETLGSRLPLSIEELVAIEPILTHLRLAAQPPPRERARRIDLPGVGVA